MRELRRWSRRSARSSSLLGADFADLFEVKEGRVEHVGERVGHVDGNRAHVRRTSAARSRAATHLDFAGEPRALDVARTLRGHRAARRRVVDVHAGHAGHRRPGGHAALPVRPARRAVDAGRAARGVDAAPARRQRRPRPASPRCSTGRPRTSPALRIFDPEYPDRAVVAAGAPWFMTLFGRDSLLTSWMTMLVDPDLALGTLQTLARFQGEDVEPAHRGGAGPDPARDALRRDGVARARRRAHLLRHASTPRRCS